MADGKDRKLYYSMGEVAEMFDVNPSLIRYWERQFDVLKPHKNKKGNRMFTPQDIDNLKLIYHLVKERGMTLSGAQKRIRDNRDGLARDLELVERLQSLRALLLQIKQDLREGGVAVAAPIVPARPARAIPAAGPAPDDELMGPQPRVVEQTLFDL